MLKHIRALGIAGLTTLSASQLALAGPDSVLWSQHKDNAEVIVSGIKVAGRTISRLNRQRPLVRFTSNEVGGTALVPLLAYEANDRCSPDFDPAPFQAEKGSEVWANFEFVNVAQSDRDLLVFGIKADKPGRKDRFRLERDIGCGHAGNKPGLCAMISPPAEGDYGYYFLDRGILKTDELLQRNPGAAIKITISSHARGPVG
ncbi:MAG TPA: hypothetical protein VMA35_00625 [Candidatus Sulfopaludibacter sp.]|nr:hypothetical protein [Candidatus Sulfopaludibacter sp.]